MSRLEFVRVIKTSLPTAGEETGFRDGQSVGTQQNVQDISASGKVTFLIKSTRSDFEHKELAFGRSFSRPRFLSCFVHFPPISESEQERLYNNLKLFLLTVPVNNMLALSE